MQQSCVREIREFEVIPVKSHLPSVILRQNAVTYLHYTQTEMTKMGILIFAVFWVVSLHTLVATVCMPNSSVCVRRYKARRFLFQLVFCTSMQYVWQ